MENFGRKTFWAAGHLNDYRPYYLRRPNGRNVYQGATSGTLFSKGYLLNASLIGRPGHKGGNFKYERLQSDVEKRLLGDSNCWCTTFFDFYGLPKSFPGKHSSPSQAIAADKSTQLKHEMSTQLTKHIGADAMRRFIPYVQMYEFEALLFSDPKKMAAGMERNDLEPHFSSIVKQFSTPEEINNSPNTAPSKRIEKLFPGYEKPLHGTLSALKIELTTIRKQCILFDTWLQQIEAIE